MSMVLLVWLIDYWWILMNLYGHCPIQQLMLFQNTDRAWNWECQCCWIGSTCCSCKRQTMSSADWVIKWASSSLFFLLPRWAAAHLFANCHFGQRWCHRGDSPIDWFIRFLEFFFFSEVLALLRPSFMFSPPQSSQQQKAATSTPQSTTRHHL